MSPTLQSIKKSQRLTNKDIARSMGISASTVGMMLQGRHMHAIEDETIQRLADALDITFERCWLAMQESYNEWSGKPLDTKYERPAEMQYRVATNMQMEDAFDKPRSTNIDGVLVVAESHRISR
jgi:plasmid maintenance system antidote protein VapI